MSIYFQQKLLIPSLPNFIMLESKPRTRQEGFKEGPKVSIADLTDEQLQAIGEQWTQELIALAQAKRLQP